MKIFVSTIVFLNKYATFIEENVFHDKHIKKETIAGIQTNAILFCLICLFILHLLLGV